MGSKPPTIVIQCAQPDHRHRRFWDGGTPGDFGRDVAFQCQVWIVGACYAPLCVQSKNSRDGEVPSKPKELDSSRM